MTYAYLYDHKQATTTDLVSMFMQAGLREGISPFTDRADVETDIGLAYKVRLEKDATSENIKRLTKLNRNGGERAVRDYIEYLEPKDIHSVLVLHEEQKVPELMRAARVPSHFHFLLIIIRLSRTGNQVKLKEFSPFFTYMGMRCAFFL